MSLKKLWRMIIMTKKDCPAEKDNCPCDEFSKQGTCDYPYSRDMTLQDCQNLTHIIRTIDNLYKNCPEIDENNVETS